jgi:hypothetical protein
LRVKTESQGREKEGRKVFARGHILIKPVKKREEEEE